MGVLSWHAVSPPDLPYCSDTMRPRTAALLNNPFREGYTGLQTVAGHQAIRRRPVLSCGLAGAVGRDARMHEWAGGGR